MADEIRQAYKDFTKLVLRSAFTSVASYTAPANVQSKTRRDPKEAIRQLRQKVKERMGGTQRYVASPAGLDKVWPDNKEFSPTGIYIKKRGKKAERKTSLQTISDPDTLYQWWLQNSYYDAKDSMRKHKKDAYVFVSAQSVINGLIRKIQQRVGNFMSGWLKYAAAVDARLNKILLKGSYSYKGSSWWIDNKSSSDFVAVNDSAPDQKLAQFNQRVMDTYLPKQIDFHAGKTLPFFEKSLQKRFNLTCSQAKEIIATITI